MARAQPGDTHYYHYRYSSVKQLGYFYVRYLNVLSTELATFNALSVYQFVASITGDHGRMGRAPVWLSCI